jgi:hypothetical protein
MMKFFDLKSGGNVIKYRLDLSENNNSSKTRPKK